MKRREFITLLVGAAAAWPLAARAQQGKLVRLGYLEGGAGPDPTVQNLRRQFVLGMRDLGYNEGRDAAAEPAHQPWRGVGNLNLNRFDRTKAIEVVAGWSAALQRLLAHVEQLSATAAWDGLTSVKDIAAASNLIAAIPNPDGDIEEKILALTAGDVARHSLSRSFGRPQVSFAQLAFLASLPHWHSVDLRRANSVSSPLIRDWPPQVRSRAA
jgi:hypothetical protein